MKNLFPGVLPLIEAIGKQQTANRLFRIISSVQILIIFKIYITKIGYRFDCKFNLAK
jgi:hypothetical protein